MDEAALLALVDELGERIRDAAGQGCAPLAAPRGRVDALVRSAPFVS
jgi:hypothetical protein